MSQSIPKLAYSYTTRNLHWLTAVPFVGCVGTVLAAQQVSSASSWCCLSRLRSTGFMRLSLGFPWAEIMSDVCTAAELHIHADKSHASNSIVLP